MPPSFPTYLPTYFSQASPSNQKPSHGAAQHKAWSTQGPSPLTQYLQQPEPQGGQQQRQGVGQQLPGLAPGTMPPAPNASTTLANASMTLASASALGIEYAAALPAAAGGGPPGASKREPERNFQAKLT